MAARRAQRILFIAFAISLVLHLIVALVARTPHVVEHVHAQVVSLEVHRHPIVIARKIPVVPHTPPPATAIPSSPPTQRTPPRSTSPNGRDISGGGSVATQAATPVPVPTATTGACTNPNAAAGVSVEPTPADIPLAVRALNTHATASILVKLDEKGTVVSTAVEISSGNPGLDIVAMTDARNAQYAPAYKDCKPVPGEYTFKRKFTPF